VTSRAAAVEWKEAEEPPTPPALGLTDPGAATALSRVREGGREGVKVHFAPEVGFGVNDTHN